MYNYKIKKENASFKSKNFEMEKMKSGLSLNIDKTKWAMGKP
jgi:hypothetical protein